MRGAIGASALMVAACVAAAPVAQAPPAIPPTGMCRPFPAVELPAVSALESHGRVGQRRIYATPGQLACSEAALGAVDCFARAGRTLVRIEGGGETVGFDLRGQEALRISQDHVMCVPPTDGPVPER